MRSQMEAVDSARVELYDIMQQETEFQAKAEAALALGASHLNVDNAHLTRINPANNRWEIVASTDPSNGTFPLGLTLDLDTTYCRRVLEEESSIALHNAANQGWEDDPAFEEHDLQCYHGTELTVDGELYGTVCFVSHSPRPEPFSDADTLFAELIARLLEHELNHLQQVEENTRRANSITVLSRVLRHNLRNEMSVVRGRVRLLADQLAAQTDADTDTDALFGSIDRIIDLSDKARKLESVVATQFEKEPIELDSLFDRVTTKITTEIPAAGIMVKTPADLSIMAAPSLELAITELVENAAQHAGSDPEVTVTTTTTEDTVEISVADNGPGLPSDEQEVLATGVETPLIHGSGLGLWMVYWIVDTHDGTIETSVTEEGTVVIVTLPRVPDGRATNGQDVRTLERGRDRFEAVFDESFNAMVILDDDRRIIDINKYAANLLGNDGREILGRRIDDFADPSFDFDGEWEDLQATGQTEGQAPVTSDDGTEYILEYRAVTDIIPGQHLIVGQDITERKTREQALEESERRYQTLAENFPNGTVFVFDSELRYQSAHGKGFEEVGMDADELEGKHVSDVFDGEQLAEQREMYEATLEGEPQNCELCYGGRFYEVYTVPIRDEIGEVYAGHVMTQDVTEREQREQKLHETTDQLTAIIQTSPNAIIALDTEGRIQVWNQAAEDIFGYTKADVIGKPLASLDIISDDTREVVRDRVQRSLAGESFTDVESQRQTNTGEPVHLNFSAVPLSDHSGETTGVLAVAEDVIEQKAREKELTEAIRDLETILNTSECAIFFKDADGCYQMLNTFAREMLSIDSDRDITGLTDFDLFPEDVAERYQADDQQVLDSGEPIEVTEEVLTEQGTRTYLIVKSPIFDENGEPSGVCAVGTDITAREERDQLEAKNERLEQFASLLSHDLRNPLTVAQGNVALAQDEYTAGEELETTSRALDRMESLIDDVLALARQTQDIEETGPISLSAIAEDCWTTIDSPDATLEVVSDYCFTGDAQRVKRLFENIFRNAIEHGGADDPTVESRPVDADGVPIDDAELLIRVGPLADRDGFYIENSGKPIPEAERESIFDDGYSTGDEGLGLGLAIVAGVVNAHDWDITVTDGALRGPRFEITKTNVE